MGVWLSTMMSVGRSVTLVEEVERRPSMVRSLASPTHADRPAGGDEARGDITR